LRSVALIGGVLGRAGQRGQERRKHDAKMGQVPWTTPRDLQEYMKEEKSAAIKKRKEVMGRMQEYQGLNEEEEGIMKAQHESHAEKAEEEDILTLMTQATGEAKAEAGKPADRSIEAELNSFLDKKEVKVEEAKVEMSADSIEAQLDTVVARTKEVEKALDNRSKE
jgi:small subunit ribosomal protein S2